MGKLWKASAAVLLALAALPSAVLAQAQGTITGTVTAAENGAPLAGANIVVQGTVRRATTDAQGRYRITIEPGNYTVAAATLGRAGASRQVTVATNGTATANFSLAVTAVQLEGLVVQATGETQRAREVGNAVSHIDVARDVPLGAVNDVAQVLQGRTSGVSVLQSSGTSGTGARIRIRGSASVSLNNAPLVIIDGVRAESGNSSIGVGGQTANRLTDMNPEEIENVEVLKGPAASALYGTAAANGVLVITTRKGRAGRTTFRAYSELGQIKDVAAYPANYNAFCTISFRYTPAGGGAQRDSSAVRQRCPVGVQGTDLTYAQSVYFGAASPTRLTAVRLDSVVSFNPLLDPRSTPFRTGPRNKFGASATGGSEQVTFFLSADREGEGGVYKYDLSTMDRTSLRANLRANLTQQFDVTVSTGYINSDTRLPQNDNNALGVVSGALLSTQFRFDSISNGFGFGITPRQISNIDTHSYIDRFIASTEAHYRPLGWLSVNGAAGIDHIGTFDVENVPANQVPYNTTYFQGYRDTYRTFASNYTANANATASFDLSRRLTSMTSAGFQYSEEISRWTRSLGFVSLPGTESLTGTSSRFTVGESNFQVRTIGTYVQEQLGLNDRFFVTGAVRGDRNSAFGNQFGWVYYPSLTGSWVVSEEPFFPKLSFLSSLRLRSAYGASGLRPGVLDALQYLSPVAVTYSTGSVPGFTIGGAGNVNLRPEKSTELELGFDTGLFGDRLATEFTYFNKTSKDALVNVPLAPSLGLTSTRRQNLGSVQNKGTELLVRGRVIDASRVRWDATFTMSRIHNELTELGVGVTPIIFGLGGASQRHTPGRPLGAYFARPYTYADANGDNVIQPSEITFTSDTAVYVGSPFPNKEASFQTNIELFKVFRISGLLDYRGGNKLFNSTEEFRATRSNGRAIQDPTASLEDQAAAVARVNGGNTAIYGYVQDASFVKLRELSLTLGAPQHVAEQFRLRGLSLTLAGRNLHTWTKYRGLDPEINYAGTGSNFNTAEFLTQPPARYYTARIDLQF